jgi:hypothetical protein
MVEDAPPKPDALPFPDSVCHGCAHSRKIETKTSKFLLRGAGHEVSAAPNRK